MKSQAGTRPRIRFEAKRLRGTRSRREYLGSEGLGCFLDGQYARDDDIAGMLGYVQADGVESEVRALENKLKGDAKRYALLDVDQWIATKYERSFTSYRTIHSRRNHLPDITVQHTLLDFCN